MGLEKWAVLSFLLPRYKTRVTIRTPMVLALKILAASVRLPDIRLGAYNSKNSYKIRYTGMIASKTEKYTPVGKAMITLPL